MNEKYLSIITNFGCHYKCPYCIVKNNNINIPPTTIKGLDTLKEAVEFEKATIVSVSGGGDPLYRYGDHKAYWAKLFRMCKRMNIPLELHTSYIDNTRFPYEKCYRVVYHCRSFENLLTIRRHGNEIVRAVFVVTEDFDEKKIKEIAEFVKNSEHIDELSFRQMVDSGYRPTNYCADILKAGHKKDWWYIEQNDYNPYYVNGDIYYKFSEIGVTE